MRDDATVLNHQIEAAQIGAVRARLYDQGPMDLQRLFHPVVAVAAHDHVNAIHLLRQLFVRAQTQMRFFPPKSNCTI